MYATPLGEFLAALPPLSEAERQGLLRDSCLTSLIAVFTRLPDPRHHQGRRYSLPFLLTCLEAALRNLTITLIHRSGSFAIAASRRAFAYHSERVLALLLSASSPASAPAPDLVNTLPSLDKADQIPYIP